MYSGLFGDLPATQKSTSSQDSEKNKEEKSSETPGSSLLDRTSSHDPSAAKKPKVDKGPFLFVPTNARNRKKASQPKSSKPRSQVDDTPFVLKTSSTGASTDSKPKHPPGQRIVGEGQDGKQHDYEMVNTLKAADIDSAAHSRPPSSPANESRGGDSDLLRALHLQALEDPYDPLVPNDLLL